MTFLKDKMLVWRLDSVDARGWGREEVTIKGNEREFLVTVEYFYYLIEAVNI